LFLFVFAKRYQTRPGRDRVEASSCTATEVGCFPGMLLSAQQTRNIDNYKVRIFPIVC